MLNMRDRIINISCLIALIICGVSCQWEQFSASGLAKENEKYNDLTFADSLTGYLGGERMSSFVEVNHEWRSTNMTVLYKTIDQGKSWVKMPLNLVGSVDKILTLGDTLIVLLQHVSSNSVYILRSIDGGRNWSTIFSDTKGIYIRDIKFNKPNKGYILIDDSKKSVLLKFNSNRWDTIFTLSNGYSHSKIIQNKLFSVIPNYTTGESIGVLVTDITTLQYHLLHFDKPYSIWASTADDKFLYLSAYDNKAGKILKISDNDIKTIGFKEYSDYHASQIFVYKNTWIAVASRNKDAAFLGVIHHFLISKDNGQSWTLEDFPESMYLDPAAIFEDKFFIAYCGMDFFQIRK